MRRLASKLVILLVETGLALKDLPDHVAFKYLPGIPFKEIPVFSAAVVTSLTFCASS